VYSQQDQLDNAAGILTSVLALARDDFNVYNATTHFNICERSWQVSHGTVSYLLVREPRDEYLL